MLTAAALILVAIVLAGTVLLVAISPGRPAPLRDAAGRVIAGSLSERVTVEIGGIPQGMFIQSARPANPVLLFLHGDPGMTEFFMEREYPTGLDRQFFKTALWRRYLRLDTAPLLEQQRLIDARDQGTRDYAAHCHSGTEG